MQDPSPPLPSQRYRTVVAAPSRPVTPYDNDYDEDYDEDYEGVLYGRESPDRSSNDHQGPPSTYPAPAPTVLDHPPPIPYPKPRPAYHNTPGRQPAVPTAKSTHGGDSIEDFNDEEIGNTVVSTKTKPGTYCTHIALMSRPTY